MEVQTTLEERFGQCPYATTQSLISGKWAVLILFYLEDGPVRFNEPLRKMPKMTHATLSLPCNIFFLPFLGSPFPNWFISVGTD